MRWFTLLSGVLVVAYLGAAAVDQYWSGVAFTKSWWPAMLVPIFLIALLGLFVGCLSLLVSVVRRKTKPIWLLVLVFPLLCVGMQFIPMPGFVDGMAHSVQRDFDAKEIHRFAEQARALKVDWSRSSSDEEKGLEALKHAFPEIIFSGVSSRVIRVAHLARVANNY
jgi:hypothetical protein